MPRAPASMIVRHAGKGGHGGRPYLPAFNAPEIVEARTVFTSTVRDPDEAGALLKSGHNNPKVGRRVEKGRWAGFPIFTLTLEERATCPSTCRMWRACMGNNMPFADRWRAGPELEEQIAVEVAALQVAHRRGFAVRLHVLGDFYSERYARLWAAMMFACPALHVFGFTARTEVDDPITRVLARIRRDHPTRWFVRFSGADIPSMASEVVEMPGDASPGSIVCPQQTDQTLACATCGLCWATTKNIAFLRH